MCRNIVEVSVEVSFKQGKSKKIHACVLVSCEEKLLVFSGAQAVTGRLMGAGYSHHRHKLEVQLQPVAREPCVNRCLIVGCSSRPSSRSHIYLHLVILSMISFIYAEQ